MWFGCKLPSLRSVSCSKDIWELSSRGHIFQLLLTRAPFQRLQHFRINNLAFPFTRSEATLTWLLRYLVTPAKRGPGVLRAPRRAERAREAAVPAGAGAESPAERGRPPQPHRLRPSPTAPAPADGQREAGRSSPRAGPTPRLLLSPFGKPRFPSHVGGSGTSSLCFG